jgi:hypothetical protein
MPTPTFRIHLDTITKGFDGHTCWVQARAGAIPGEPPAVVMTMQKLLLSGSDIFYALNEMRTDDLGQTWSGPTEHGETLGRRQAPNGIEVVVCDFNPKWHAVSGVLLGTGHTARYLGDELMPDPRPRETAYAVYDQEARVWTPWQTLQMPDEDVFFSAGAGSAQRVDLPDGTILLPIYCKGPVIGWNQWHHATVVRCAFDGRTLSYLEHGNLMTAPDPRGFCEPSLTHYQDRYFLTLRNDVRGYVTVGDDGLHYADPRPWTFDDGEELGNYNTQQHWVTHSDGLFLTYTRRGANNDHVFRNRAPLFIAEVDPERLCVLRATERILVPERGAGLGNYQVNNVSPDETWVVVSEWMQPLGCERYGSDNSVFAARIVWETSNR